MFTHSAELYDAVYDFKDYAREADVLHALISRERRAPGGRLLDVACGTGAHLAQLRRWYDVEGVELDEGMLAVARRKLPDVPLHRGDMVDLALGRAFDVVTCLFSSIGYVGSVERLERAARALAAHVAPGGLLVVEPWLLPGVYRAGHLSATFVDRPELKVARMAIGAVEDRVSVLDMHYLVATPGGIDRFVERHALTLFTHEEYLAALERAGLEVTHEAEGLTGRGLYIGRRPA